MALEILLVEEEMTKLIQDLNDNMGLGAKITIDTCPDEIGISSQILVTIMGRLEDVLKVAIPENCYLFYDKPNRKQLTLKEASQKLIKVTNSKNGK